MATGATFFVESNDAATVSIALAGNRYRSYLSHHLSLRACGPGNQRGVCQAPTHAVDPVFSGQRVFDWCSDSIGSTREARSAGTYVAAGVARAQHGDHGRGLPVATCINTSGAVNCSEREAIPNFVLGVFGMCICMSA